MRYTIINFNFQEEKQMSKKGEKCYGKTHNRCTVQNGFMTQVLGDPEIPEMDVIDH